MRLALQATFLSVDSTSDESRTRREKIERELRGDERSVKFFQRLRSAMARKDLKAPEVFADESFPDANIVAEYLDGAEISEEIADEYEKVCWDSPEILSEAGNCFDLLTNDFCRAADAPKNCRRRLYYVAWEDAARSSSSNSAPATDSATDSENGETKAKKYAEERGVEKTRDEILSRDVPQTKARENDVARTLKAGRKARLRSRSWAIGSVALVGLAFVSYSRLNDWNQRNVPIAETRENTANASGESNRVAVGENPKTSSSRVDLERSEPLLPLTISRSDAVKTNGVEAEEYDFLTENNETANERAADSNRNAEPKTPGSDDSTVARLASNFPKENRDVGLGTANFDKKPSIVIPAKNNDVFSTTSRY